jgi:hypothetical protein
VSKRRPTAIFVNYMCALKSAQKFRTLGVPFIAIFTRAALEPETLLNDDVRGYEKLLQGA